MSDLTKMYKEMIGHAEKLRLGNGKFSIQTATPNELYIYNVFTLTKRRLQEHLACIEDAEGTYMKKKDTPNDQTK